MEDHPKPEAMDRRRFYIAAIYGLWSLIGAALALPASIYLFLPPSARQKEEWVDLGEIAQFPVGVPEEKVFRHNRKDGWRMISEKATAWVTRMTDQEVVAFAPQCTHLGCAYHWDEQKQNFLCPCHASTFGLDGRVLTGPAPRPLDRYEVRIEKNKLRLGSIILSNSLSHSPQNGARPGAEAGCSSGVSRDGTALCGPESTQETG
ncbi:MAG: ubiquinol-cytochrome c reductase iron-sulfur subunit [Acidobacteriia bacterium]|nr:ubiquinol-cytochrome c reductase iron-sulfur subunit [Terriglobia bacterium]